MLEGIAVTSYVDVLKRAGCRLVFDAHNVESVFQSSVMSALSGRRPSIVPPGEGLDPESAHDRGGATRRHAADVVWACSDHDARQLERIHGRRTGMTVVPNGVDVESYRRARRAPRGSGLEPLPITLLYPGLFNYLPNEDAATRLIRDVLPAVRARGGSARLVLVGRNPTPRSSQQPGRIQASS